MVKVICASVDCEYNLDNKCKAKEIKLNDGHIHTVHQGFKHIHECKTYTKSQYYKKLEQEFQDLIQREKGGAE